MMGYYDKNGQPIGTDEWSRLFEDNDYRRIGLDTVGQVRVSTVWLGMDHAFLGGEPEIFETMVFGGDNWIEQDRIHYRTEAEALAGHQRIVAELSRNA